MNMIQIGLLTLLCILNIQDGYCACKAGAKPCDWEPWQQWGSCSGTCGAGFKTRSRKLCCGDFLPDCAVNCHRGNNNHETEMCSNSCPNGGTVVDGICQCPPLMYGICCELAEQKKVTSCARHCTWTNWYPWGDCSTDCGCGTQVRKRSLFFSPKLIGNRTQCGDDCQMEGNYTNVRTCTQTCRENNVNLQCAHCSWNPWHEWTICNNECGGGQRSRSRTPCCCKGQSLDDCLFDCRLSVNETVRLEDCNDHCHNNGQFFNGGCVFVKDSRGLAAQIVKENCTKCSWKQWEAWQSDDDDGRTSRIRRLCCPHGQSPETCMGDCSKDTYTDIQWNNNYRKESDAQYMYTAVASVSSVVLTSLVWIACFCIRHRKCRSDRQRDTRGTDVTTRGTDFTTRGRHTAQCVYCVPETERGGEHSYEEIEQSHYVNVRF